MKYFQFFSMALCLAACGGSSNTKVQNKENQSDQDVVPLAIDSGFFALPEGETQDASTVVDASVVDSNPTIDTMDAGSDALQPPVQQDVFPQCPTGDADCEAKLSCCKESCQHVIFDPTAPPESDYVACVESCFNE